MITNRIKALFNFIEFLHSNIENFNNYNNLINELEFLKVEKNKLKPENNYKDKIKFEKIQADLVMKFNLLQDNTANLIKAKAKELDVCNFENEPHYSFYGIEEEIRQLKGNFKNEDLSEIFEFKSKYIDYRSQTHKTFLSMSFFFDELDNVTKSLFDYFKDNEQNEFEVFETKRIMVNSKSKAVELYSKGYDDFKFEIIESYILPDLTNNIFDLTLQNLVDCGLTKKDAIEFLNTKGNYILQSNQGNFFVSEEEKKVYTGIEFYRKTCLNSGDLKFPYNCPDLITEYYDLALSEYLQKQSKLLGLLFNEKEQQNKFIDIEISRTKERINSQREFLSKMKRLKFSFKENEIEICEAYIQYLKRKKDEVKQPQQIETDEMLLKNQEIKIFNSDFGFTLFIKMYEHYKAENTHLANFSFLFFAMEKDFLVCNQADFVRFLETEKYDISIGKIDNRQLEWQKNKKAKLYNSIKEQLQQKHGKSTI